mmetsp:Transcript_37061/g.89384  ORF Transcript_37061/g.89384 Transcript_37061/m.89384 type:complete len:205 (+) Transcript_37061:1128-1742(+)
MASNVSMQSHDLTKSTVRASGGRLDTEGEWRWNAEKAGLRGTTGLRAWGRWRFNDIGDGVARVEPSCIQSGANDNGAVADAPRSADAMGCDRFDDIGSPASFGVGCVPRFASECSGGEGDCALLAGALVATGGTTDAATADGETLSCSQLSAHIMESMLKSMVTEDSGGAYGSLGLCSLDLGVWTACCTNGLKNSSSSSSSSSR